MLWAVQNLRIHPLRTYLTWLLFALLAPLGAQVAAPEFLCTRSEAGGEILTWQNVANDCGAYRGTRIYRAEAAGGPYTLLATLTDPTATEYRDENPGGLRLFYYLDYDYDCPGQATLTSDTLDSFIPVTPEIQFVSVEDGDLVVYWEPSPSPEVNRYVILEVTDQGISPVDTVGLTTSYRITGVSPGEAITRRFRVAALDACGNDSPQSGIRAALGLGGTGGTGCEADIALFPVIGRDTVGGSVDSTFSLTPGDSLQLFVSVNGATYVRYSAVAADSVPLLSYSDANDGDSLCFYAEIDYADTEVNQRTTVYCQTVDITQPVRDFPLYGVEITEEGRLRFAYSYPTPSPDEYADALERVGPSGAASYPDEVDSLLSLQDITTVGSVAALAQDSFRLVLTDACGRTGVSNYVTPVILAATPLANDAVQLSWSPLTNGLEGSTTYTVYRLSADSTPVAIASGLTDLSFVDDDPTTGALPCYRVTAMFQPVDQTVVYAFRSNQVCVGRETEVYLPNTFSPLANREVNREFRPLFTDPTGLTDYRLLVFDRWGALLFSGEDPAVGWDGQLDGQPAPAGSYVYVLTFTSARGNLVQRSGVVHLLY